VRETFAAPWGLDYKFPGGESGIFYRADNRQDFPDDGTWTPSIFMPRKLSRITLEIVKVRVERLNDISDEDCLAEGIPGSPFTSEEVHQAYENIWAELNGPGSWANNPWVWVLEFKKL